MFCAVLPCAAACCLLIINNSTCLLRIVLCSRGFQNAVALVAASEKGYVSVKVTLTSPGGHSSQPPVDGSSLATRMAALLAAVDADAPPAKLVSPTKGNG
jgi:acetylornithine deacetylase/succinyl-diaminopimelate desuccinylase-like protein